MSECTRVTRPDDRCVCGACRDERRAMFVAQCDARLHAYASRPTAQHDAAPGRIVAYVLGSERIGPASEATAAPSGSWEQPAALATPRSLMDDPAAARVVVLNYGATAMLEHGRRARRAVRPNGRRGPGIAQVALAHTVRDRSDVWRMARRMAGRPPYTMIGAREARRIMGGGRDPFGRTWDL